MRESVRDGERGVEGEQKEVRVIGSVKRIKVDWGIGNECKK